uniref:Multiple epidermal growth factor-like domains protein 6 n=1 Tax=Crassostrea virginica TaxID=6565 RepID=A0A8B8C6G0_CRAVI|nr:multiple epidermal growth factor-like domains protein 6 [Crassostrea virginica]
MTGVDLLVCCIWAALRFLSVQAYENLTSHQLAWQSSYLFSHNGAERAVDGLYTKLHVYGGQCAGSDWSQTTAEWRVDLGGVKNIHHVFIQHVNDVYPEYFLGFSVYISIATNKEDGALCFRDTNYTIATITNPVNITCPYHGRYVIYYNNRTHPPYPEGYKPYTAIGLCEVKVYGCRSLRNYGENCSLECPQNCQDGYCDMEGTCLACKPGFIGPRCIECAAGLYGNNCSRNCSLTCGNPGVCHKDTRHCNGSCLAGWEGAMCENECSIGFHGVNCLQNCSMTCGIPGNCDRITGYCNGGCQRGWTGVICEKECAAGLFGNNCSKNCSLTCGEPGVCDKVTGHCNGSCLTSWEGDMCENECSKGFYGVNCVENCSMTCGVPGNCDRITGYCYGGCHRGWTGIRCEEGQV